MGKLFGTDGIRGEANRYPMDANMAFSVGQAVTHIFKSRDHRTSVVIGKDTRISGYMLESSLEAGISSMGVFRIWSACCPRLGSLSSRKVCALMPVL